MTIELLLFYVAATVSLVSTLLALTRYNAAHALIYLIISLLASAIIFYLVGAPFAAVLEIVIYAGAIMVLFVFVIMMLNLGARGDTQEHEWLNPGMWFIPAALCLVLFLEIIYVLSATTLPLSGRVVDPKEVGVELFGPYVLAVEIASMLLLSGLVGAYHLGRRYMIDVRGKLVEAVVVPFEHGMALAAILFTLGLVGVMVRRNIILILMSIEVMLNSCGLAFILAGAKWGVADGQIMFMLILSIAAAEVAVGLGLLLQVHRRFRTIDVDKASRMRG